MCGAVGAASNITESRRQAALLEHARTVLETAALLVQAARDAAGNPRVSEWCVRVRVRARARACTY